jgi:hypothetical protein
MLRKSWKGAACLEILERDHATHSLAQGALAPHAGDAVIAVGV